MARTVIVTGCDSGIGKESAEFFIKQGLDVFACVLNMTAENTKWAADLNKACFAKLTLFSMDLRSTASIKNAVKEMKAKKESIFALVNVAGITLDSAALMTKKTDLMSVFEINLACQIEFTQYVVKIMDRAVERSIVFVASTAGISGGIGQLSYSASKASVINVTKTLSKELGPRGIRVNCVAPGVINTKMNENVSHVLLEKRIQSSSLGRIGTPKEVASVLHFLISDKSRQIAGQTIRIDGGLL